MHIVNAAAELPDPIAVRTYLKSLDDPQLLAQEITQKGAIHALDALLRLGVTEANVRAMLTDLRTMGLEISAACKARGLATVDAPGSN
jgi:hypothetical protein